MHVDFSCPCGANDWKIVGDDEWADEVATIRCPGCGASLTQHGNNLTRIKPSLPVSVCFLAATGLGHDARVLAVSRKDDHAAFGLPGGKVDPEDGEVDAPNFLRTVQRAVAREIWEEVGVHLAPMDFRVVYEGVCAGGKDGRAFWQVILTHPSNDWVAATQPGEGVVAWVPWSRLTQGPFGHYNTKLHTFLWHQEHDPLSCPIEEVGEFLRMHGGDPKAIGRRGAEHVRGLLSLERTKALGYGIESDDE